MNRRLALSALVLLALAACSRPEPAGDTATTPAPAAAKRAALPECGAAGATDAGADGWMHPDCRLMIPGPANLAFEARYAAAADESTLVTLQIVQPGDATIQTFAETMGNTFEAPSVRDVDLDGLADILVPMETGNVNTSWALWRQTPAGAPDQTFVRAGELNGVEIKNTASGYIAVSARSSAASWTVAFLKLDGATLKMVASVDVMAEGTENGTVTGVTCGLSTDPEVPLEAGMDPKKTAAEFCADPAAADIFK